MKFYPIVFLVVVLTVFQAESLTTTKPKPRPVSPTQATSPTTVCSSEVFVCGEKKPSQPYEQQCSCGPHSECLYGIKSAGTGGIRFACRVKNPANIKECHAPNELCYETNHVNSEEKINCKCPTGKACVLNRSLQTADRKKSTCEPLV